MKKILLFGCPNCGKSSLYNYLTKKNVHTGNWAGKTVASEKANFMLNEISCQISDVPGTYSVVATSDDEREAITSLLEEADATIVVGDATSLSRSLSLVYQLLPLKKNLMFFINLVDEADKLDIEIKAKVLQMRLGIPVILGSMKNKIGLDTLKENLLEVLSGNFPYNVRLSYTENIVIPNILSTAENDITVQSNFLRLTYTMSEKLIADTVFIKSKKSQKLGKSITSNFLNKIIAVAVFFFLIYVTVIFANYPSELLMRIGESFENYLLEIFARYQINVFFTDFLIRGVLRTTRFVIAVMFPPMAIFFPLFAIFEDLGFLPRLAYALDRCFDKTHTNSKQCLTMCMGLGCNASGVASTRIIESKKDRLIAIITNTFTPCNGRFPTIIAICSIFFSSGNVFLNALCVMLSIAFGIVITLLTSYLLEKIIYPQQKSQFSLEITRIRKINVKKILVKSFKEKTLKLLIRAVIVAIPTGGIIFLLANLKIDGSSLLTYCSQTLNPFATFIGLDGTMLTAFILGFPANEIVLPITLMIYQNTGYLDEFSSFLAVKDILLVNGWTSFTAISFLTFSLLHWPCSTTLLTIKKETKSNLWTLISFLFPTFIAIILGVFLSIIFSFIA